VVDAGFGHQALEDELTRLPATYSAPNGLALLADSDDGNVGCAAFKKLNESTCEMKRLFVSKRGRHKGVARQLCEALISSASSQGYSMMKLDTANRFTEAMALYKSIGFVECPAYIQYPPEFAGIIHFFERTLAIK
jgi:GNAT superfamily N-acetyltransferase